MNSELGVLIYELKLIRNNVHGGLKSSSNIHLTHSEVISFVRAFVNAVHNQTINPFHELDIEDTERVMLYLNLIRTYGIPHCDRSRNAQKCLSLIESVAEKKKTPVLENEETWDNIPF